MKPAGTTWASNVPFLAANRHLVPGLLIKAIVSQLNEATTAPSWRAVPSAGLPWEGFWTRLSEGLLWSLKGSNHLIRGETELGSFRKKDLAGANLSVCYKHGGVEQGRRVQKMDPDSVTWQEAVMHELNCSKSHLHVAVTLFTMNRVKQWNSLSRKAVESQYLEILKTQLDMTTLDAVNLSLKRGIRTRTWLDNFQRLLPTSMILKFLDVFW